MVIQIKNNLMDELQEYGAFDVSACYNCGTCTATCPFVEEDNGNEFPRGMIRLAQLGQKDKLLGSKELWMCYYCGDCSAACPREADPAEFMQSARRYAIANYEPTGLSKLFNQNKKIALMVMAILGVLFGALMEYANVNRIFEHDYPILGGYFGEIIHFSGIGYAVFLMFILGYGVAKMYRQVTRNEPLRQREYITKLIPRNASIKLALKTLWDMLFNEGILQKRFKRIDPLEGVEYEEGDLPAYISNVYDGRPKERFSRWLIHMSIVWGFAGLALATAFDYLVKDLILHDPAGWVPIYHPVRILGIVSGIALIFGTSTSIYYRIRKASDYYKNTQFDDWLLIITIWVTGITGFLATIMVYLEPMPAWSNWVLVAHVVSVGELFLLIPVSKFGHMIYRPLALWLFKYEEGRIQYIESLSAEEQEKLELIEVTH